MRRPFAIGVPETRASDFAEVALGCPGPARSWLALGQARALGSSQERWSGRAHDATSRTPRESSKE
jgi:hypothetical protein